MPSNSTSNSSSSDYEPALNVERRTWDRETFEKRAKARIAQEQQREQQDGQQQQRRNNNKTTTTATETEFRPIIPGHDDKEEFMPAAPGAAGPERSKRAFLRARQNKVSDIDNKIGSVEFISPDAIATTKAFQQQQDNALLSTKEQVVTKTGIGWHCKVCDCFLKDSHAYLDHINGRKHQRRLGFSMRVERSTKEQVQDRLQQLVVQKQQKAKIGSLLNDNDEEEEEPPSFVNQVKEKDRQALLKKQERSKRRKERKKKQQQQATPEQEEATTNENETKEEEEESGGLPPDMAALMGFSGFGGGNKNH